MTISLVLLLCISGLVGGLFMGLIGAGLGPLVVAALQIVLPWVHTDPFLIMKVSITTSLATILVTTVFSSVFHKKSNNVDLSLFMRLLPGSCLGAITGSFIVIFTKLSIMKLLFAYTLILISLVMLFNCNQVSKVESPCNKVFFSASFGIALISSIMGVSDGLLMVPFLRHYYQGMAKIIGTASLLIFPVSLIGIIPLFISGLGNTHLPQYCLSYIYLPALLIISIFSITFSLVGVAIGNKMPVYVLKFIYCTAMVGIGLKMML